MSAVSSGSSPGSALSWGLRGACFLLLDTKRSSGLSPEGLPLPPARERQWFLSGWQVDIKELNWGGLRSWSEFALWRNLSPWRPLDRGRGLLPEDLLTGDRVSQLFQGIWSYIPASHLPGGGCQGEGVSPTIWRGSKPNCVHGNQSYFVIPICLYLRKQSFQNLHLYLFKTYPEIVREPVCVCVCVCVCVLTRNTSALSPRVKRVRTGMDWHRRCTGMRIHGQFLWCEEQIARPMKS